MPDRDNDDALTLRCTNEAALQLVIAEYQSVAGLIQYFREVELKALAGAGLVLSVVAAAYATLATAENTEEAQAVLVVSAAWVPAVSLLVVLMATLRGFRAVVYMNDRVHPLATELTRDHKFLAYEVHAEKLFVRRLEERRAKGPTWFPFEKIAVWLVPGVPVTVLTAAASVGLGVIGFIIRRDLVTGLFGVLAAVLAVILAVIGVIFARLRHGELRRAGTGTMGREHGGAKAAGGGAQKRS